MEVYLIRHTTPGIDRGICYGQSDIGVADTFPEEVVHVKVKLPGILNEAQVYSSPSKRCLLLAKELSAAKPIQDKRLKELDFGEWELRKWEDVNHNSLNDWMESFIETPCPDGESYRMLQKRVLDFWKELPGKGYSHVMVVTHGGVIRCLLSYVLDIPLKNSFRLNIDYGSISVVSINGNDSSVQYINR